MRRLFKCAVLLWASMWLSLAYELAGQEDAPWVGTWELDPSQSTDRPGPDEYRRVTFRIEPTEQGIAVIYDMVGIRGGVTHLEWNGAFDGGDYAVQGVDYVLTNAYTRIDRSTYELIVKLDGQVAAMTRASVSDDGQTLTAVTTERDVEGETIVTTAVYQRR